MTSANPIAQPRAGVRYSSRQNQDRTPCSAAQFVRSAVAAIAIAQGQLIQALARFGRVLAGDARPAEPVGGKADTAGHCFQRQIEEAVSSQLRRHLLLLL